MALTRAKVNAVILDPTVHWATLNDLMFIAGSERLTLRNGTSTIHEATNVCRLFDVSVQQILARLA
jgi:hypothetical protein